MSTAKNYQVVNKENKKEFTGKGKEYTMQGALDLYDSIGGAAKGYSVKNINRL
tara:strand:+ start:10012 stop:10170 length:159 start_codon:yes stop_codon:yes gene_type:complete